MTRPADGLALRHPKVQRLRKLVARRAARDDEGVFVVEGAKVLDQALDADAPVEAVYATAHTRDPVVSRAAAMGHPVFDLAPGVIEKVADTTAPQAVLAVIGKRTTALDDLRAADLVVVAVDVRDPGNLGTVMRSAEAAGAGGVICCDGCVDVFNPKTVRASAGAVFHVPVVVGGQPVEVLERIGGWPTRRLATVARGGQPYHAVDLATPVAFVFGNEAHGLPDDVAAHIDEYVTIPMAGRTESLNVGMAAAVLCFEAARQRGRS